MLTFGGRRVLPSVATAASPSCPSLPIRSRRQARQLSSDRKALLSCCYRGNCPLERPLLTTCSLAGIGAATITVNQAEADQFRHKKVLFQPTTTPGLQPLLDQILRCIILPSYLTEAQRRRVFLKSGHADLAQNPVVLEIEGTSYQFPPMDKMGGDVPAYRPLFWRALKLMRSRRDWDNLPNLAAGYQRFLGRRSLMDQARIIRLAGAAGHLGPVLHCLRQPRTGLVLDSAEKLSFALCFLAKTMIDARYTSRAVRTAARWTDILLDMARRPAPGRHANPHGRYVCTRPYILPLALFPTVTLACQRLEPRSRNTGTASSTGPELASGPESHLKPDITPEPKPKPGDDADWARRCLIVTKQVEAMLHKWKPGQGLRAMFPPPTDQPDGGSSRSSRGEPRRVGPWYLHESPSHWMMVATLSMLSMRSTSRLLRAAPVPRPDLADRLDQIVIALETELAAEVAQGESQRRLGMHFYRLAILGEGLPEPRKRTRRDRTAALKKRKTRSVVRAKTAVKSASHR